MIRSDKDPQWFANIEGKFKERVYKKATKQHLSDLKFGQKFSRSKFEYFTIITWEISTSEK